VTAHAEESPASGIVQGSEDWQQSVSPPPLPPPLPPPAKQEASVAADADGWRLREEEERDLLEQEEAWGSLREDRDDVAMGGRLLKGSAASPARGPPDIEMPPACRDGYFGSSTRSTQDTWRVPVGVCLTEEGPDWKPFRGEPEAGENEVDNSCPCQPCRQVGLLGFLGCGAGVAGTPLPKAPAPAGRPQAASSPVLPRRGF